MCQAYLKSLILNVVGEPVSSEPVSLSRPLCCAVLCCLGVAAGMCWRPSSKGAAPWFFGVGGVNSIVFVIEELRAHRAALKLRRFFSILAQTECTCVWNQFLVNKTADLYNEVHRIQLLTGSCPRPMKSAGADGDPFVVPVDAAR